MTPTLSMRVTADRWPGVERPGNPVSVTLPPPRKRSNSLDRHRARRVTTIVVIRPCRLASICELTGNWRLATAITAPLASDARNPGGA